MKLYPYLFVSFIIHFFIIFPWWCMVKKNEAIKHVLFVHAYVDSNQSDFLPKKIKMKNQLGLTKNTNKSVKESNKIVKQKSVEHLNDVKNDKITHRLLLKMLHEQIAKKQVFPESALELNESGTVTIHFIVSPDGAIHDVILYKSSGVMSLDLAALKAVVAISPLQNISELLKKEEEFSIDVVYRLINP